MKKLIALSALSLFMASAYATNHCPAGQTCTYPIGTGQNDKTIYFTELQPGNLYRCSFYEKQINAIVEVRNPVATAGVKILWNGYTRLPAIVMVDTKAVPAGQKTGNAAWFTFKAVGLGFGNTMTLQCAVVK